jgi:drug/metabolite transporter (DMT)-like permease
MINRNFTYPVLVGILLILWATAFVAIRHALEFFTPANLAFLRYLIASVSFILIAVFKKFKKPALMDVPHFLNLGFLGFTAYNLLLNYGEQQVDAGLASFIINTSPFIAVIWIALKREEELEKSDWIGLLMALLGIAIIIFSKNKTFSINIYALLILGAAIAQGIYFVVQKRILKKYTPLELTAYSIWAATLQMLLFTKAPFQQLMTAKTEHLFSLFFLGLFPGSIAYLIVALLINKYKMSSFASYLFLIPFIAVFTGYVFLNEVPSAISFIGGLMIIAGILVKNKIVKLAKHKTV